jgi:hypothetical protein
MRYRLAIFWQSRVLASSTRALGQALAKHRNRELLEAEELGIQWCQTHLRIKAFLSGVFNRAKQVGAISGDNPLDNAKAGGTKKKFKGAAYMLNVIQDMLEKIPEPARTVCATAAFTGLSASTQTRMQGEARTQKDRINIDVFTQGARSSAG